MVHNNHYTHSSNISSSEAQQTQRDPILNAAQSLPTDVMRDIYIYIRGPFRASTTDSYASTDTSGKQSY